VFIGSTQCRLACDSRNVTNFAGDMRYFVPGWPNIAGDVSPASPVALTPMDFSHFSMYTYVSLYYTYRVHVVCASIQRLKAASVFNKVSCQSVHNAGCKHTAHRLNTSTLQPGVASSSWPVPSLPLLAYLLACLLITYSYLLRNGCINAVLGLCAYIRVRWLV